MQGSAFIDAGGGVDSLTVRNTGVNEFLPSHFSSIRSDDAAGLAGNVAGLDLGFTAFRGIDRLTYTAGNDHDQVFVDVAALLGGAKLWVDAAGGSDTLVLDLLAFSETRFIVAPNGTISGNLPGTYRNFESFSLTLGNGANVVTTAAGDDTIEGGDGNDRLKTGDGNDFIRAGAGVNFVDAGGGDDIIFSAGLDTIDGGDGYDTWSGDYASVTEDITVIVGAGAGTISNGVSFVDVEIAGIALGSGNDVINVTGPASLNVSAGEGTDTLTVDYSLSEGEGFANIDSEEGRFIGSLWTSESTTAFDGVEHLAYIGSAGDDIFVVDPAALASGATLSLNGAAGHDWLDIDFTTFAQINFVADDAGNVTSNVGSFGSFESFTVRTGDGDDHIVTASGNDVIASGLGTNFLSSGAGDDQISSGGVDVVDGGDGFDAWTRIVDAASSEGLTFNFDGNSGTLSDGTQLTNIETVSLTTGSGDDVVNISGAAFGFFGGGAGMDSFTADFSGTTQDEFQDYSEFIFFLGTLTGLINGQSSMGEFEDVTVVASDGDSRFAVEFRELLPGITLDLDGGLGTDTLLLEAGSLSDAIVFIVESDGTANSNLGLEVASVENYSITGSTGNDVIVTGTGDDFVFGDAGDDVLAGGAGADDLYGSTGADTFLFQSLADFGQGILRDAIQDFSSEEGDLIDLAGVDADAGTAGDQAFAFIGDAAFSGSGTGGELRYETDGVRSLVQGDVDGDGVADFTLFVDNVQSLSAADFIL
ncbi:calcium-binding protein [Sphingosinicella terrae]|uniref:calcium-binding protein n=1 Tax=Sphingosinicella terrae TaxID=2172047 RepID=UPI0025492460|nr:calcium-binding protein [Sphingosinicella terrae]